GNAVTMPAQSVGGGTVAGSTTGGGLGDVVVQLMSIGGGDVNAVLRMGERNGDVKILSRPVLIAANNTEATFMVGTSRAFPTSKRTLPNDNATTIQEFVYKDVATRLTILPTISHDGYVSLEILQEVNQATAEVQLDSPVISTREAHTQVLVKDGQTIMLGGLRDQQNERNQSGVPFLSRIPILGGLFGSASRIDNETELFLFLTPRILRTDADVEQATNARLPARVEGAR
ncbi:MAG TPA: type II and III secretion system protein, partial [Gemmatimonadales bacterium]